MSIDDYGQAIALKKKLEAALPLRSPVGWPRLVGLEILQSPTYSNPDWGKV